MDQSGAVLGTRQDRIQWQARCRVEFVDDRKGCRESTFDVDGDRVLCTRGEFNGKWLPVVNELDRDVVVLGARRGCSEDNVVAVAGEDRRHRSGQCLCPTVGRKGVGKDAAGAIVGWSQRGDHVCVECIDRVDKSLSRCLAIGDSGCQDP